MALQKAIVEKAKFNNGASLPFQLRLADFEIAMQDVYDFFYDVNKLLLDRGLHRLDDMLRPAAMSGMISDMLTASMAKRARSLVENKHFNGHPDLIVQGHYKNNAVASPSPQSIGSRCALRKFILLTWWNRTSAKTLGASLARGQRRSIARAS